MSDGATFAQRSQLFWSLRAGSHTAIALLGPGRGGRAAARRAALAAAGLLTDAVHRRWQGGESGRGPSLARTAVDVAEAAAWTLIAGPSPTRSRWVQQAHVAPAAHEAGFRFGAGVDAVPIVVPARPFPPPRGTRGRAAVEGLAPVLAPLGTHVLLRRARGWSWSAYELIWPSFSAVGELGLARHRDALQRRARARWWVRADEQVEREARRSVAHAAVGTSPGHDFKKTLTALAHAGSAAAREASHEQLVHPYEVAAATDGTTLWHAAMGIPIVPDVMGDTWLGPDQRAALERRVEQIDAALEGRDPQPSIQVVDVDGAATRLRYRGRTIVLSSPAPRLDVTFDALAVAVLASATWKAITAIHPSVPAPRGIAAASVLGDLAVIGLSRRMAPRDDRFLVTAVGAAATSLLLSFGIARAGLATRDADGEEVMHASGATFGLLGVIGTCRDQLDGRWARALVVGALSQWAVVTLVGHRRDPWRVAAEAVALWQAYAACRGLTTSLASEAELLEAELHEEFRMRLRVARHEAEAAQRDRHRAQLDLAERELARLRGTIDPDLATFIEGECAQLRAWLSDADDADQPLSSA